jgi:iron complex outermembrane receptor protein
VLLVPQKPTDRLEGYVEGSAGSYDMWRVQAVANIPLAETFKVRLGIDRMKRDGYLINHSGIGPDRLGNTNFFSGRLSIVADLTPDLENYTIGTYSRSKNFGVTPRLVDCWKPPNPGNPADPANIPSGFQGVGALFGCAQLARQNDRGDGWWDIENSEPDPIQDTETWQVINTTTWHASDTLTVKNIVSYAELRETSRFSLEGENYLHPVFGVPVFTVIRIGNTPGLNTGSQSTFTEELQFQGRSADDSLNWQAGGYLEISNPLGYMGQTSPFMLNCPDAGALQCYPSQAALPLGNQTLYVDNISQPWQKRWFRSTGLYAQGTYRFTDRLSLTAGLRYTWDEYRHFYAATAIGFTPTMQPVAFCNNPIASPGPDPAGGFPLKFITPGDFQQCAHEVSGKASAPTWLVGLDYKPIDNVLIYAKYARGYRSGGVNAAYAGYESWEPEKVDAYELGAKVTLRGAVRGYFNVAGGGVSPMRTALHTIHWAPSLGLCHAASFCHSAQAAERRSLKV